MANPPSRVERAHANLESVLDRLRSDNFMPVHAGRWRHLATGLEVETGYVYGEGTLRVYPEGEHQRESEKIVLRGADGELDRFNALFPAF